MSNHSDNKILDWITSEILVSSDDELEQIDLSGSTQEFKSRTYGRARLTVAGEKVRSGDALANLSSLEVTSEMRENANAIVEGVLESEKPFTLAARNRTKLTQEERDQIINDLARLELPPGNNNGS